MIAKVDFLVEEMEGMCFNLEKEMKKNKHPKNIVVTYWKGEISLVKSFWIVAVVFLTIVSIPSYIIDDQAISKMSDTVAIAILVWTVFFYLFLIYTYVGLWRSSSKYIADRRKSKRSTLWGFVVYAVIIIGIFTGFGQLIVSLAS